MMLGTTLLMVLERGGDCMGLIGDGIRTGMIKNKEGIKENELSRRL